MSNSQVKMSKSENLMQKLQVTTGESQRHHRHDLCCHMGLSVSEKALHPHLRLHCVILTSSVIGQQDVTHSPLAPCTVWYVLPLRAWLFPKATKSHQLRDLFLVLGVGFHYNFSFSAIHFSVCLI